MSFRNRRTAELARERILSAMALRQPGPESAPSAMAALGLHVVVAFSAAGQKRVSPATPMAHTAVDAEDLAE